MKKYQEEKEQTFGLNKEENLIHIDRETFDMIASKFVESTKTATRNEFADQIGEKAHQWIDSGEELQSLKTRILMVFKADEFINEYHQFNKTEKENKAREI